MSIIRLGLLFLCLAILHLEAAAPCHIDSLPYPVLRFVAPFLPQNPVVVECGGFNGQDTTLMARVWPRGTIHSFEPVPSLFAILTMRTALFQNVKRYELALADKTGKMTFYYSENSGTASGSGSLLPPKDHNKYDDKVTFNGTLTVNAMTLDDWAKNHKVDHVDFLWLDMQGFELNMLKVSEIAKKAKMIYIEVLFVEAYAGQYLYPDVKKWMEENGFELIALDFDESRAIARSTLIKPGSGQPYYGNALFLNRRK